MELSHTNTKMKSRHHCSLRINNFKYPDAHSKAVANHKNDDNWDKNGCWLPMTFSHDLCLTFWHYFTWNWRMSSSIKTIFVTLWSKLPSSVISHLKRIVTTLCPFRRDETMNLTWEWNEFGDDEHLNWPTPISQKDVSKCSAE